MKKLLFTLIFLILLLAACESPATSPVAIDDNGENTSSCGDGTCTGVENRQNCPADCAATAAGTTTAPATAHAEDAPLFMTTMTHMEKSFNDDQVHGVFDQHIQQLTYGMDLADAYGAKLTIESEQSFAIANTRWSLNFMAQIVARGHGTGTHCDFGFHNKLMPVEQYAQFFAENKALVDALVEAENNLGCSGGGGANDWARAASLAGFKYLDGIVGMHYLSMPLENRPDPSWTDEYIFKTGYHTNSPVDLYERIYPFMVAYASDFIPDENGTLLVSSGEMGLLAGMDEGVGEISGANCRPECIMTNADVNALVTKILEVDQNRDRTRIAKLTVYIPANMFVGENEPALRTFFEQMQTLTDQGIITWATQKEVYEAYVNWNK